MAILKKFIGANQVDGSKLLLDNDQAIRAKDASGDAQALMKLDSSNFLQFLKLPRVAQDPSDANDIVRKSYVDTQIETGVTDLIGQADGIAPLGSDGKIPNQYYSSLVITDVFVVADIAARDALSGVESGDVAKVVDAGNGLPKTYIYKAAEGANPAVWIEIESGSDVDSVNGQTGAVLLDSSHIAEAGGTNRYYTPTRQAAIEAYADQAESDAVSSAIQYTDQQVDILEAEDLTFLKLDGTRGMEADLNMASHKITNVTDPTSAQDAATKAYVDGAISNADLSSYVKRDGSQGLTGNLSIGSFRLTDLGAPMDNGDAANKGYVDSEIDAEQLAREQADLLLLPLDGMRSMTGNLNLGSFRVVSVGAPMDGGDAANKSYVDSEIDAEQLAREQADLLLLPLDGMRSMTGNLNLGSFRVVSVGAPMDGSDAANKSYVDFEVDAEQLAREQADLLLLPLDGMRSMTGNLNMGSFRVTSVGVPMDNTDAATKGYVDAGIGNLENEDLTFLKLDGSRVMTGVLDAAVGIDTPSISGVTSIQGDPMQATQFTGAQKFQFAVDIDMNTTSKITNLANGASAGDAVNKGQLDAGVAEAKSYADAQLDTLSVQELAFEQKMGSDIASNQLSVTSTIVGTPWISVGRVMLEPSVDFTVSGSTITFIGSVASGGAEALESGDKISIWYHKSVAPFV